MAARNRRIFFRADWVDRGQSFIVNRIETGFHIVLFDRILDATASR